MNTFDDRKKAFESKYANDAEMQFKVMAKRNKFVGLWAAELLGKSGNDAENYAMEVIKSDMEEAGDEDVIRKVKGDLGNLATDEEIRAKLNECYGKAMDDLAACLCLLLCTTSLALLSCRNFVKEGRYDTRNATRFILWAERNRYVNCAVLFSNAAARYKDFSRA